MNAHTLPQIDDTIATLIGANIFSMLDLKSGYWQVEMGEGDKEKTVIHFWKYGLLRMQLHGIWLDQWACNISTADGALYRQNEFKTMFDFP